MSGREWVWCWFAVACITGVAAMIMLAGSAKAATAPVTVDRHGVVTASTIPPCTFQGSVTERLPCSYNFGTDTGNLTALAYWLDEAGDRHPVWGKMPSPIRSGWSHWATRSERSGLGLTRRCWVHVRTQHVFVYKCPV